MVPGQTCLETLKAETDYSFNQLNTNSHDECNRNAVQHAIPGFLNPHDVWRLVQDRQRLFPCWCLSKQKENCQVGI